MLHKQGATHKFSSHCIKTITQTLIRYEMIRCNLSFASCVLKDKENVFCRLQNVWLKGG